jgi:hypothetical protein
LPEALSDAGAASLPAGILIAGGRLANGAVTDRLLLLRSGQ